MHWKRREKQNVMSFSEQVVSCKFLRISDGLTSNETIGIGSVLPKAPLTITGYIPSHILVKMIKMDMLK